MRHSLAVFVSLSVLCTVGAFAQDAGYGPKPAPVPGDLAKLAEAPEGFKPLFADDLSNAVCKRKSWSLENGVLTALGGGDIWTKEDYGDFILDLEFKCAEDTNSGVFIRTANLIDWLNTAIEIQVLQPNDKYPNPKWHCGAIFDCLAPCKQAVKEPGAWNHYTIIAKDNMIWVELNGALVLSMDLDQWTEPHMNPDGTKNKFKYAYKDLERSGRIGFQYHGHPVWFRNIKIKPLKD